MFAYSIQKHRIMSLEALRTIYLEHCYGDEYSVMFQYIDKEELIFFSGTEEDCEKELLKLRAFLTPNF